MSGPKKVTLRVQSSEGTARVELQDSEPTSSLYEKVHEALRLASFAFALHKDRARKEEIISSRSRTLREAGLVHGDMIYLNPVNGAVLFDHQPTTSAEANNKPSGEPVARASGSAPAPAARPLQTEDEVDILLYQMSGKIQRQRDEKLCRHNSKGCCVHCSPLEPWDENYLKEHNIKHMSFHSYLRKITSGKFVTLEELSCKIKPGCKEHPPWPRGICSACQPSAVTLQRQPYRHVDNVLIERSAIVERFLSYWRATGHQRVGLLLGTYEQHPDVPLGVRARVSAIYEPPQSGSRDHVALLADPHAALLASLAGRLGLQRVGWIFTDLLPDDRSNGTVKHIRGVDTHFLSAQECITAAHYQNQHPNACRHAPSGYFGSKFVTVCVTGDASQQVALEGYQVSGQCAALARDGVLVPTRDAPELGYIRDSSDAQYVPDVYYKERDEYGNEVGVAARRVPVAYLLVDVPVGVSREATPPAPREPFPPAHRPLQGHLQTLRALHQHIQQHESYLELQTVTYGMKSSSFLATRCLRELAERFGAQYPLAAEALSCNTYIDDILSGRQTIAETIQAMSDIHVLLYLATNDALPLTVDALGPLLDAVRTRDAAAADAWRQSPHAATIDHLAAAASEQEELGDDVMGLDANGAGVWTCALCTFHNAGRRDTCEMCAMPRNNGM